MWHFQDRNVSGAEKEECLHVSYVNIAIAGLLEGAQNNPSIYRSEARLNSCVRSGEDKSVLYESRLRLHSLEGGSFRSWPRFFS
jgi:hypothetical protein